MGLVPQAVMLMQKLIMGSMAGKPLAEICSGIGISFSTVNDSEKLLESFAEIGQGCKAGREVIVLSGLMPISGMRVTGVMLISDERPQLVEKESQKTACTLG